MKEITEAKAAGLYTLRLQFSDGTTELHDFEPELKSATNPVVSQYLNPRKFNQWRLENGILWWNNDWEYHPEFNQ